MPLKILQHLLERPAEVVSRAELQSLLWKGTQFGDFEQGLNTAMNVLRRTLGDSAGAARYIETVPGVGYRFIAPIRSAVSAPETHASSPAAASGAVTGIGSLRVESANGIGPASVRDSGAARRPRKLWAAAVLLMAALGGGAWWKFQSKPDSSSDGLTLSANQEANDQFNVAMNFLVVQNDITLARKSFERALELDPHFSAARLQVVLAIVIEIYNGFMNDGTVLYRAEEELHRAEAVLPASDGLLLSAQTAVYLAQGRLDRIPSAKLAEYCRQGGNPTWLVILRMLEGQTAEPLALLRGRIERDPLENPSRMFLGELLRTLGETASAIEALERALQQAPRNIVAAWFLTLAYLDEGKPEQARALLEGLRHEYERNYMWRHAWAILLAARW